MNIDHILIFNINCVNPFNFKSQSLNSSTKQSWVSQVLCPKFDSLYKLHCQSNLSSQHYLSVNWILADETSKGSSVLLYFCRVIVEIQNLLFFVGNLRKKNLSALHWKIKFPFDCRSTIVLDAYNCSSSCKEILTKKKQTVETWTLLMLGPLTIIHESNNNNFVP